MPENVSTQHFETGNVSFRADGAVTGRRFLTPAGRTGGPALSNDLENLYLFRTAGVGDPVVGVSKYDVADDESGGVHGQPGMTVEVTAGAAIAVGDRVVPDAQGRAVPAADANDNHAGLAMAAASGVGVVAEIKLA